MAILLHLIYVYRILAKILLHASNVCCSLGCRRRLGGPSGRRLLGLPGLSPMWEQVSLVDHIQWLPLCHSFFFHFPFVGVSLVIRYSVVWLLLLFLSNAPCCWPFLSIFLLPLPFSDLSSHNPPISAVVFLVLCNLLVSLPQIFLVISHLSFFPCVQPILSSS